MAFVSGSADGEGWELVAVARADSNAMAALGTAARQNGSSALSLHAAAKSVGLRAAAAIGLKCALRHGSALLKNLFNKLAAAVDKKIPCAAISEYITHAILAAKDAAGTRFFTTHGATPDPARNLQRNYRSRAVQMC
jgi:hypothetical protein